MSVEDGRVVLRPFRVFVGVSGVLIVGAGGYFQLSMKSDSSVEIGGVLVSVNVMGYFVCSG